MAGSEPTLRVALLGCGVVGSEVVRLLTSGADDLAARAGARLELAGVAVRRPSRVRSVPVAPELITTDAAALVARDDVDLVVEVIGGIEPARSLILAALRRGASVVTANKALLAEDSESLFAAAQASGADLYFEAAVAGAIPLVRPLRESLVGDNVRRVLGIVNGTTNFVLDRMDTAGSSYAEALEEAQALGYAEADPTADVEGFDAAAKAAIIASLAFHTRVTAADVHREGITGVTAEDIASAAAQGCVVKLLSICELLDDPGSTGRPGGAGAAGAGRRGGAAGTSGHGVSARVHPAMIPRSHPLASVREAFNAVFVESAAAGRLMFYGPGAGGAPTASAVLGDLVTVARHKLSGARGSAESTYAALPVLPMGQVPTRYHISLDVADRPGVLAQVAALFAERGVSIQTVRQSDGEQTAQLVVVTHVATDAALSDTVAGLRELDIVTAVTSVMRVEADTDSTEPAHRSI